MSGSPTPAGGMGPARAGTLNLANGVTLLRLCLVPLLAWLLLQDSGDRAWARGAAFVVFVVAMATDRLDGELARRRGLVTDVGKLADPIADKALTGTAFVVLSLLGELAWAVTAVVLVREVGVTLLRLLVLRHGVIPASRGGKAKTALQALALALYILPLPSAFDPVRAVAMALAVVVTVVTGLDYLVQALRLRAEATGRRRTG